MDIARGDDMKKMKLAMLMVPILYTTTGCGPASNHISPILSGIPNSEKQQIVTTLNSGSLAILPTWLPFKATNATISSEASIGRHLTRTVTIRFEDKTEVLVFEKMTSMEIPSEWSKTQLSNHFPAYFNQTKAQSELLWLDVARGDSYTLYSSNKHGRPDLSEQQLIKIADTVKYN